MAGPRGGAGSVGWPSGSRKQAAWNDGCLVWANTSVRRILALGVAVAFVTGCGGGGELDAGALSQQAKSLQSVAAEGALLAEDAALSRTTRTFSDEHSTELGGAASQTAMSLEAATTTASLDPKRRRLAVLATQVTSYLDRIRDASGAEDRALSRRLEVAALRIESLGRSLT